MTPQAFYEALVGGGYKPMKYSGRSMYGVRCIALDLESVSDLLMLGAKMQEAIESGAGLHIEALTRTLRTDSLGRGIVAYWPGLVWDDSTMKDEDDDE